jgi:hypothetical protein
MERDRGEQKAQKETGSAKENQECERKTGSRKYQHKKPGAQEPKPKNA